MFLVFLFVISSCSFSRTCVIHILHLLTDPLTVLTFLSYLPSLSFCLTFWEISSNPTIKFACQLLISKNYSLLLIVPFLSHSILVLCIYCIGSSLQMLFKVVTFSFYSESFYFPFPISSTLHAHLHC